MCKEEEEVANYLRLVLFFIDIGTKVLFRVFVHHARDVKKFLSSSGTHVQLKELLKKKILSAKQFHLVTANSPKAEQFDISLLITLMSNLFAGSIEPPDGGWKNNKPVPTDLTVGADLIRLRRYRNAIVGHKSLARISGHLFSSYWNDMQTIFTRMYKQIEPDKEDELKLKIDEYRTRALDQQAEQRHRDELNKLQEICEDVVQLQEKVEKLSLEAREFAKFFEKEPRRYSRYIRLLFDGGQLILVAVLRDNCSKHGRDIGKVVDENMKPLEKELGTCEVLRTLKTKSPEEWDILFTASVVLLEFREKMQPQKIHFLTLILKARKEYAKAALESLDESMFSTRCEDLVRSLTFLSFDLGIEVTNKLEEYIAVYRSSNGNETESQEEVKYVDHLKLHGIRMNSLSDVYKEKIQQLKDAMKKLEDEGVCFKNEHVFQLKIITLGNDLEKQKLAEEILASELNAALKQSDNLSDFKDVRQQADLMFAEFRNRGIRVGEVERKCIILSLKCKTPCSVIEMMEYIESTQFQEQCILSSYELSDIHRDVLAISASLTLESLCEVLISLTGDSGAVQQTTGVCIPLACVAVEEVQEIENIVRANSTTNSLKIMAEELSNRLGAKVSLKLEPDFGAFSEIYRLRSLTEKEKDTDGHFHLLSETHDSASDCIADSQKKSADKSRDVSIRRMATSFTDLDLQSSSYRWRSSGRGTIVHVFYQTFPLGPNARNPDEWKRTEEDQYGKKQEIDAMCLKRFFESNRQNFPGGVEVVCQRLSTFEKTMEKLKKMDDKKSEYQRYDCFFFAFLTFSEVDGKLHFNDTTLEKGLVLLENILGAVSHLRVAQGKPTIYLIQGDEMSLSREKVMMKSQGGNSTISEFKRTAYIRSNIPQKVAAQADKMSLSREKRMTKSQQDTSPCIWLNPETDFLIIQSNIPQKVAPDGQESFLIQAFVEEMERNFRAENKLDLFSLTTDIKENVKMKIERMTPAPVRKADLCLPLVISTLSKKLEWHSDVVQP